MTDWEIEIEFEGSYTETLPAPTREKAEKWAKITLTSLARVVDGVGDLEMDVVSLEKVEEDQ